MSDEKLEPENTTSEVEVDELDDKGLEEASGGIDSEQKLDDINGFMCNC